MSSHDTYNFNVMSLCIFFYILELLVLLIGKKRVQGVIVAGMKYVSSDIEDAYSKIGMVKAAGGQFITVDEGNLGMNIVMEEK